MDSLHPLPPGFAATRDALHRVAEELVAPARKPHNEIALTPAPGGFGTPPFELGGERTVVRVEGAELVLEAGGEERRAALESIAAGAELLGPELLPDGMPADETPLAIDPDAAAALAAFYAFAADLLARFRDALPDGAEPSPAILWPEHFDLAIEAGAEAKGERANYGASPGDADHAEPYLYVGPWTARPEGELWNAAGFPGAELAYAALIESGDPGPVAHDFLAARFAALQT
ncbi:MAG TPA: hypothetical protein VFY99_09815 [Solirubrobacterales bacterium]